MPFISISIDLCGSTHIKQEMVRISQNDPLTRKALYQRYIDVLFKIEREFYELLGHSRFISLKNLYLAKLIGDEFWFLYEISENDEHTQVKIASDFSQQLLTLLEKERFISFHEKDEKWLETYDLPIKVYVDVIEDVTELSAARYEYLKDLIQDIANRPNKVIYRMDSDLINICHQLNLCSVQQNENNPIFTRPDFIGLEVDRFFRLTKQCYPQVLTFGNGFASLLRLELTQLDKKHRKISIKKAIIPEMESERTLYGLTKEISSNDMKGVSEGYPIYYVFNRRVFKNAIAASEEGVESLLDETRAFLAENGFFAIKEK